MPAKNGSVAEAPGGGHITQCGATADDPADGAAAEDPPALAAEADLADPPDEVGAPAPVADAVVAAAAVVVDGDAAVTLIAGKLTAPDRPPARAVPAIFGAVVAVCAAPGPASSASSTRPILEMKNRRAMDRSEAKLTVLMRRLSLRSSPVSQSLVSCVAARSSDRAPQRA